MSTSSNDVIRVADHLLVGREAVPGVRLRCICRGHTGEITCIDWSPCGRFIASASEDGVTLIWDARNGRCLAELIGNKSHVYDLAWAHSGLKIAMLGETHLRIWEFGDQLQNAEYPIQVSAASELAQESIKISEITSILWSVDDQSLIAGGWRERGAYMETYLASFDVDARGILVAGGRLEDPFDTLGAVISIQSDKSANRFSVLILSEEVAQVGVKGVMNSEFQVFKGRAFARAPHGLVHAVIGEDAGIALYRHNASTVIAEGHAGALNAICFSCDGQMFASKSMDGTVKLWRTDPVDELASIPESTLTHRRVGRLFENCSSRLAFSPNDLTLASLGEYDKILRIWEVEDSSLAGKAVTHQLYTSAKVVLVGESNVGKSCLAMRLAEDRYPQDHEQCTTHGMRFWPIEAEQLHPSAKPPQGQRRDVVLWDFGGQDEYQLVHQMFLHDTTLALIVIDPTRDTAFEDARRWVKKLEKRVSHQGLMKLLVGTKVDGPTDLIDRAAINALKQECGFEYFIDVSAKTSRNIDKLREAIQKALHWDELAKASRPELFQRIRDEIELMRESGEIVVLLNDLESSVRGNRVFNRMPPKPQSRKLWEFWKQKVKDEGVAQKTKAVSFDSNAFIAVTDQLSAQGVLVKTMLVGGDNAVVLQLPVIEQYAGSLILLARNNPRAVPAIEEIKLASPHITLPGIDASGRIDRLQERVVIECVTELMIKHGICFRHERLLVFPSLLRSTESAATSELSGSVSLYYDFSGAIDNVYASLIAWLVIGKEFGKVRLWNDRVEFEVGNRGACGLRKVNQGGGYAHLDIYFDDKTPLRVKTQFISFVHDHLKANDIEVVESFELICSNRNCRHNFPPDVAPRRLAMGKSDVQCPICDTIQPVAEGIKEERLSDTAARRSAFALMTRVRADIPKIVAQVKHDVFARKDEDYQSDLPIRVLHLSDLHFDGATTPETHLRWLLDDIRKGSWLIEPSLDFVVVSGDMTSRGQPDGFHKASDFVSNLIAEFSLSAERCIFVPGNHDVAYTEDMYMATLSPTAEQKKHGVNLGEHGFLVRNEERYWHRFETFSNHFYQKLLKEYPKAPASQGVAFTFPDVRVQFLGLNSCWEIDRRFPLRASLYPPAVANLISEADRQIEDLPDSDRPLKHAEFLRIAVWHHPVHHPTRGLSNPKILDQLANNHVRLCLTGDIHEMAREVIRYHYANRMHIVGAGSFSGSPNEGSPRLYNLIEIPREVALRNENTIKLWTRHQVSTDGLWSGWNQWPSEKGACGGLPYFFV